MRKLAQVSTCLQGNNRRRHIDSHRNHRSDTPLYLQSHRLDVHKLGLMNIYYRSNRYLRHKVRCQYRKDIVHYSWLIHPPHISCPLESKLAFSVYTSVPLTIGLKNMKTDLSCRTIRRICMYRSQNCARNLCISCNLCKRFVLSKRHHRMVCLALPRLAWY